MVSLRHRLATGPETVKVRGRRGKPLQAAQTGHGRVTVPYLPDARGGAGETCPDPIGTEIR